MRGLYAPAEQGLGLVYGCLVVLAEVPEAGQGFLQLRLVGHLECIEAAAPKVCQLVPYKVARGAQFTLVASLA